MQGDTDGVIFLTYAKKQNRLAILFIKIIRCKQVSPIMNPKYGNNGIVFARNILTILTQLCKDGDLISCNAYGATELATILKPRTESD
jgi:hypothetical protein